DDQRAANSETLRQLQQLQESVSTLAQQRSTPAGRAGGEARSLAALALTLLPQTRGAGTIPVVSLPPDATGVTLALRLESNRFTRYRAALKDPATNAIVWRSTPLPPSSTGEQPTVTVTVPTAVLKPQHYAVELAGVAADGAAQPVGSYAVR